LESAPGINRNGSKRHDLQYNVVQQNGGFALIGYYFDKLLHAMITFHDAAVDQQQGLFK
jgi:hypothetical protein